MAVIVNFHICKENETCECYALFRFSFYLIYTDCSTKCIYVYMHIYSSDSYQWSAIETVSIQIGLRQNGIIK